MEVWLLDSLALAISSQAKEWIDQQTDTDLLAKLDDYGETYRTVFNITREAYINQHLTRKDGGFIQDQYAKNPRVTSSIIYMAGRFLS